MNERVIRLDTVHAAREEVISFEGQVELQAQIRAAFDAGDEDALADLRAQYRRAAHQSTRSSGEYQVFNRQARSLDPKRSIAGYAATWDAVCTTKLTDGTLVAYRFGRHAFDGWIARFSPRPVLWTHGSDGLPGTFGQVVSARTDEVGLRITCTIDDTPAGAELLRGCDDGLLGFSCHGKPVHDRDTGEVVGGLPLFEITETSFEEASLCLIASIADPASIVTHVGGGVARYRREGAARDRDVALRRTFGFRQTYGVLSDLSRWRPGWGG
jgi:hypothetical protein